LETIEEGSRLPDPIISSDESGTTAPFNAIGTSIVIHEWRGSGPPQMHVHHADDEAWHVLEGELVFRFSDKSCLAAAGQTVFVPAGVPHTYEARNARYLIVLTPRLDALIKELQTTPDRSMHAQIYIKHESTLLE
jgi:mannose-6-phosphate isomerase-like protein (cupin superfamily)